MTSSNLKSEISNPHFSRPPLVLPGVRRRPRRRSPCDSLLGERPSPRPPPRLADPLAPQAAALRAEGEARHLSCSWPARRATWSCSTTSRSWRSSTARCRRPELLKGYRAAFINPNSKLLGPKFKFAKHGQCGAELSELLPHLAKVVDDIAIVKSMVTDAFNHAPAQILMNTGSQQFGRPSIGAWVTVRPGQRVAGPARLRRLQHRQQGHRAAATRNWGSGFLPTVYQGVPFRSSGEPVLYLSNPRGVDARAAARLARRAPRAEPACGSTQVGDPEIATRINSFEMAFRMQASAPELMDLSKEPKQTLEMYGAEPGKPSFANNCLLARRLVERGVRFVQLFHEAWDQHGNLVDGPEEELPATPTRPCAALIKDLKQRGLLDDTLVIWGGEFGRTPMVQGGNDGRDHHPNAFTMWLAGGGIKPGITLGETDELGFNAAEDRVHVHDLHATILHLLGFDHTQADLPLPGPRLPPDRRAWEGGAEAAGLVREDWPVEYNRCETLRRHRPIPDRNGVCLGLDSTGGQCRFRLFD